MAVVLFSRPSHDDTIAYLYEYSKELVELSKSLHKTINLENKEATKSAILEHINRNVNFIMFNGHGTSDCICCHNNEIIIDINNLNVLKNTITYSLSCSSAKKVGNISIENGALCFVGYTEDFALGKDPNREATPLKDRIAKLFLEPSNFLVQTILKGKTVKEAVERAKNKMLKNIDYLNSTDEFLDASHYAPYLFSNYLSLVAYGKDSALI